MREKKKEKKKKFLPAHLRKNLTGTVQKNKKSSSQSLFRKHRQRRKVCLRELKTQTYSGSTFAKPRSIERKFLCGDFYTYFTRETRGFGIIRQTEGVRKGSARRRGKGTIWSPLRRHNGEGLEFGSSESGSIWCISSELGIFWRPPLRVRTFPARVGFV